MFAQVKCNVPLEDLGGKLQIALEPNPSLIFKRLTTELLRIYPDEIISFYGAQTVTIAFSVSTRFRLHFIE